jgi:sulfoxide reductase heme-binding subunit YedZ
MFRSLADRLKAFPFTPAQLAVHIYAWSALAIMIFDLFTHHLTANPIQAMELRTGRHAIALLTLSLACTPLNTLLGWRDLLKRRRALGLYALMYATLHVIIFINLDFGFAWDFIVQTVIQKSYILYGITAFILLTPLAMTSFDIWKTRLGKNWKVLHELTYYAAPIAALHYAEAVKGDLFHLSGDISRPLTYFALIALLLTLRLPFLRRFFSSLRTRAVYLLTRRGAQPPAPAE